MKQAIILFALVMACEQINAPPAPPDYRADIAETGRGKQEIIIGGDILAIAKG